MEDLQAPSTNGTTLQLDIPVLLPDAPDAADACTAPLMAELTGREGVTWVHLLGADADQPAKLCIHYDPEVLSLGRIKEIAEGVGAEVTQRFGHVIWHLEGITSAGRARTVTDYLLGQPGVQEAAVSAGGAVRIEFDRSVTAEPDLRRALEGIGEHLEGTADHAHDATGDDHDHDHGGIFGERTEIIFAGISGVLLVLGTALPFVIDATSWLPLSIFIGAYLFGGYYLLREAIDNLRLRRLEIDALMLVAAAGAAALDKWAEGALLLVLFSLGHALEHYAMDRARRAISALADLAPPTAEVRRAGLVSQVPIGDLMLGETVIVRPNSRIPADGFVTSGFSAAPPSMGRSTEAGASGSTQSQWPPRVRSASSAAPMAAIRSSKALARPVPAWTTTSNSARCW